MSSLCDAAPWARRVPCLGALPQTGRQRGPKTQTLARAAGRRNSDIAASHRDCDGLQGRRAACSSCRASSHRPGGTDRQGGSVLALVPTQAFRGASDNALFGCLPRSAGASGRAGVSYRASAWRPAPRSEAPTLAPWRTEPAPLADTTGGCHWSGGT